MPRSALSAMFSASRTRVVAARVTRSTSVGSASFGDHDISCGMSSCARISFWIPISSLIPSWATSSPSAISSSGTSSAPPSTIRIALSVPATTMSRSE